MANHHFDCVVDTGQMAVAVESVNRHINETSAAVVAMKAAVIAAEEEGADHVCQNVNRGFYALIHSQISQKMAALKSEVDAKLMRLNQQTKQLAGIRQRMQRDYQMISSRYGNIFNALNRALRQRIMELDRPVMNLVTRDANQQSNRQNMLISDVPVGQIESVKISQRIATSSLKKRAADTIEAIHSFIADSNHLDRIINKILLKKRVDQNTTSLLAPVAIIESNYDNSGNQVTRLDVSHLELSNAAVSAIENRMNNALRNNELNWSGNLSEKEDLKNQFRIMVNGSSLDNRRKEMIIKLFESNNFQTF